MSKNDRKSPGICYAINEDHPLHVRDEAIQPKNGIVTWLRDQAAQGGYAYLLAHALDGVIWGRVDDGQIITIHDVAEGENLADARAVTPPFVDGTLTEARLFGPGAELHVWRKGQEWYACWKTESGDGEATYKASYQAKHMLWGDRARAVGDSGFTLMEQGTQGLQHVVPLALAKSDYNRLPPLRLELRHYLSDEEEARVILSRLETLSEEPPTEEKS